VIFLVGGEWCTIRRLCFIASQKERAEERIIDFNHGVHCFLPDPSFRASILGVQKIVLAPKKLKKEKKEKKKIGLTDTSLRNAFSNKLLLKQTFALNPRLNLNHSLRCCSSKPPKPDPTFKRKKRKKNPTFKRKKRKKNKRKKNAPLRCVGKLHKRPVLEIDYRRWTLVNEFGASSNSRKNGTCPPSIHLDKNKEIQLKEMCINVARHCATSFIKRGIVSGRAFSKLNLISSIGN
jgi:hypothetical protein